MRDLSKNPIGVGILGCGSFVQRRILPLLPQLATLQVVAIQKRHLKEAQAVAKKFSIPHAVSTRTELLQLQEVEAVLIATPNHQHEEDAIACAQYHKPTLCEKPLAPTVPATINMLKAFEQHHTSLYVGQSLRFKPCIQQAKSLLQSGALGQLLSLRAHFTLEAKQDNWRFSQALGGGVLQDLGVHLIDLIRFIAGEDIVAICAFAKTESTQAEHSVSAVCRLTKGALASFECSLIQPMYSGFEVVGSKGRLISCHSLRQTDDPIETFYHLQDGQTPCELHFPAANIYLEELKHFAQLVNGAPGGLIEANEGLENQKVIAAAYQSIAHATIVHL